MYEMQGYLVCSMNDNAATLASSIIEQIKTSTLLTIMKLWVSLRACLKITGGYFLGFPLQLGFSGWKYHVLVGTEADVDVQEGFDGRYLLEVDKYMEVVDVYALTLLGTTLKDLDSAISWVEKAALPKNKQLSLLSFIRKFASPPY
ncbi:hypothetical protein SADUNF_Sadunf18G0113100 [Salix dunnii]|uniref:Uncharacterized protein n=1 Tax=Salix dunnii TaxID=1413687 RepID=A0A835J5M6_9ROSI|nr:hypothetical protein SADUNF_Sadunf18G0113100 [Salix dunnii]